MTYRDRDQQTPLPKPYGFVPKPGSKQLAPPAGHDRYRDTLLMGQIDGVIVAHSDIHVSSGLMAHDPTNRTYPLYKAHVRTGGRVVLPGSSLKGCIRSLVEAISPSAVHVTRARIMGDDRQLRPERDIEKLDPAARLFGSMGYLGPVHFSDALLEGEQTTIVTIPQLFRPRAESQQTYFDKGRLKGRKFYMHGKRAEGDLPLEACPPASRFRFTATFSNLRDAELGLLLTALGISEAYRFCPKLGGGKPACLGTIEFTEVQVQLFQPGASYLDFDSQGEQAEIAPLLDAAQRATLVLHEQATHLAEILRYPNEERTCPGGSY